MKGVNYNLLKLGGNLKICFHIHLPKDAQTRFSSKA